MSTLQDTLLHALASAMAPGQKVLLVQPSFDLLSLMAMSPVKELVILSPDADPDAPAGETGTGAPLRMRPDYRERPRSKDLIIDPDGHAPVEAIERLLKKQGVYISNQGNAVTDALPCTEELTATLYGIGTIGPAGNRLAIKTKSQTGDPGPSVVAATRVPFEPGKVEFPIPLSGLNELEAAQVASETATTQIDEIQQRLEEAESALEVAQGTIEAQVAHLSEQTLALEGAAAEAVKCSDQVSTLQAELSELETEYDALRTELAEIRVATQRDARQVERNETTQRQLIDELESLRAEMIKLDGPAADLSEVIGERDTLRKMLRDLATAFHEVLSNVITGRRLPAPPVPGTEDSQARALTAWIEQVGNRAAVTSTRNAERESAIRSLRSQLTRAQRRAKLLEASTPPSPPPTIEVQLAERPTKEVGPELEALQIALRAETLRRTAAEQSADAAYAAAANAVTQYDALRRWWSIRRTRGRSNGESGR